MPNLSYFQWILRRLESSNGYYYQSLSLQGIWILSRRETSFPAGLTKASKVQAVCLGTKFLHVPAWVRPYHGNQMINIFQIDPIVQLSMEYPHHFSQLPPESLSVALLVPCYLLFMLMTYLCAYLFCFPFLFTDDCKSLAIALPLIPYHSKETLTSFTTGVLVETSL